ncbi:YdeI/OmpD-associated family protein [Chitinophaga vietnamensis]|uniref:YdeI/OmpD-associated family protein n=1 Tax=Chitinophaga vietnamensis TaxID=2593957 RepID=UPI0011782C38|nr:YdeI family protein [Chitinophaga vietnamensis]
MNPKVDKFIGRSTQWQEEFEQLRTIVLDCQLTETLKWGVPCYTYQESNIVLMHGFKDYCALLFFKGALMADPESILVQQTENVQSGRQLRFTSLAEIKKKERIIKAYIHESIEVERAGLKVDFKKSSEYPVPEEFQQQLDAKPALKAAFEALTPGRQRGYLLFFAAPKQSKTRSARVEKYTPQILDGKGLND